MCSDIANGEYKDIKQKNENSFSGEAAMTTEKDDNIMQDIIDILPEQLSSEGTLPEGLTVDVVQLLPEDDIRPNDEKNQATECSSSFGDSLEEDGGEVESELREGNRAKALVEDGVLKRRKKRPLSTEWKAYRQGIEWRCRWLELRVKQLEAESNKYDGILALSEKRKQQYFDDKKQGDLSTRTSMMVRATCKKQIHILHRQRHRKAEEDVDLRSYMSKHPVFSRYEKKKQPNQGASIGEANKNENQRIIEFEDDFNCDFEDELRDKFLLEEDSMGHYLWRVEAMLIRVAKLRSHLAISYKNGAKVQCSPGPAVNLLMSGSPRIVNAKSSPKTHGSTSMARRRIYDFDTNDLIMPDNVMANYVEPVRHAFIETPHWQVDKSSAHASDGGGSSSEDTDDEAYKVRHAEMQLKEREQHGAPIISKKNKSRLSGKENCNSSFSGKERPPCPPPIIQDAIEDFPALPSTFAFIPRRKRRKRESTDVLLTLLKDFKPLPNNQSGDLLQEHTETCKHRTRLQ